MMEENNKIGWLKELLESHEKSLDERFVNVDNNSLNNNHESSNVNNKKSDRHIDFWTSTDFHGTTPRPIIEFASDTIINRGFQKGDIVIFIDPYDDTSKRKCTGRVIDSPFVDTVPKDPNGAPTGKVIRRAHDTSGGLYKIQTICKYVIPEYYHAQTPYEQGEILQRHTCFASSMESREKEKTSSSGKRLRKPRFHLLLIDQLESYEEYARKKVGWFMSRSRWHYCELFMKQWHAFVEYSRKEELRNNSAKKIQKFLYNSKRKAMTMAQRILEQMEEIQKENERERLRQEALEEERKREHEAYLKVHGVTRDHIHYFLTTQEMDAFYVRLKKTCERVAFAMSKQSVSLKQEAIDTWKNYITNVLPPTYIDLHGIQRDVKDLSNLFQTHNIDHAQMGDLANKLSKVADSESQGRNRDRKFENWNKPWRPSLNISLPRLPAIGITFDNQGAWRIENLERYKAFNRNQMGPCDNNCWLIHGLETRILFGGYPTGPPPNGEPLETTMTRGALTSILYKGITTFVCLTTPQELDKLKSQHPKKMLFDVEADIVCQSLRSDMMIGLRAAENAYNIAKQNTSRARAVQYGVEQIQKLQDVENDKAKDYNRLKAKFDTIAPYLNHVYFSMPVDDHYVTNKDEKDREVLEFLRDLENRLRNRERLFIFSNGGSGRVGVVACILMARLYGLTPHEAMQHVQLCHDAQGRYDMNDMTKKRLRVSCPKTHVQKSQVLRLLQYSEPEWDTQIIHTLDDDGDQRDTVGEVVVHKRAAPLK